MVVLQFFSAYRQKVLFYSWNSFSTHHRVFGLTLRGFGPNNAPCVPMAQVAQDNGEAMTEIFELRQEGEDLYISGGLPSGNLT